MWRGLALDSERQREFPPSMATAAAGAFLLCFAPAGLAALLNPLVDG